MIEHLEGEGLLHEGREHLSGHPAVVFLLEDEHELAEAPSPVHLVRPQPELFFDYSHSRLLLDDFYLLLAILPHLEGDEALPEDVMTVELESSVLQLGVHSAEHEPVLEAVHCLSQESLVLPQLDQLDDVIAPLSVVGRQF